MSLLVNPLSPSLSASVCVRACLSRSRPYAAEAKAEWHPLEGSLEWLTEVLPALKSAGEVPPLECMQVTALISKYNARSR